MIGAPTNYWGKLEHDEDGAIIGWLPLFDHMIDVAACFESLMNCGRDRILARTAGLHHLSPQQRQRLCVLAFLHDLGKLNIGFQAKSKTWSTNIPTRGHVTEAVGLLLGPNRAVFIENFGPLLAWFTGDDDYSSSHLCRMLICSWSHHGRPAKADLGTIARDGSDRRDLREIHWEGAPYADLPQALRRARQIAEENWPLAFKTADPIPCTAAFMETFNGLLTKADWLGSNSAVFQYDTPEEWDSRHHFSTASAERMTREMGLAFFDEEPAPLEEVFPNPLYEMQAILASSSKDIH